jgi:hypothetical protein
LPRELDNRLSPRRDALTEIIRRHRHLLEHLSSRQLHFPQRGLAVETGPLEQHAVAIFNTLRECARIVRVDVFDGVSRHGNPRTDWRKALHLMWLRGKPGK